MTEKEIPLEERTEKIFESGWVNEFNYLENLMQETRSCLCELQQKLQRKDNIINKIKKALKDHKEIKNKTNTKEYYIEVDEVLDYIKELEERE